MRRSVLDLIGDFDAKSFGLGYGEENDYCLRALMAGFKNVLAHDVFVYHTGRVSFSDVATENFAKGQASLHRLHPDYEMRIESYVKADPAREARARLDLYRLAKRLGENSAVLVTHNLGGGVTAHVKHLSKRLQDEGVNCLTIRVAGNAQGDCSILIDCDDWLYAPSIAQLAVPRQGDLLAKFLQWLKPKIFHVHSLAGLDWSSTLKLFSIIQANVPRYFCTLHDFGSICHRNNLVTSQAQFCGAPAVEACQSCVAADNERVFFVDPIERRAAYRSFLEGAQNVFVPSHDTADRLSRIFPTVALSVRPHEELVKNARAPIAQPEIDRPLRVALIGAIGPHKGCHVLYSLALDARQRKLPIEFIVIGYSNISSKLDELGVKETGRYDDEEAAIAELYDAKAHFAFFPSIWPETFAYTLTLALAAGLPAVAFDLGAPAERLRALKTGRVLDLRLADQPTALNDALLALPLEEMWRSKPLEPPIVYDRIVETYYGNLTA